MDYQSLDEHERYPSLERWKNIYAKGHNACLLTTILILYALYGLFMAVFYPCTTIPLIKELNDNYITSVSIFPSLCAVMSGLLWLVFICYIWKIFKLCTPMSQTTNMSSTDHQKNASISSAEWTMFCLLVLHLIWFIFGMIETDKLESVKNDVSGREKEIIAELLHLMLYQVGIYIVAGISWLAIIACLVGYGCLLICKQ